MVIESDAHRRDVSELILATLRFAVAPAESVEKGLSIIRALRPSVIVCRDVDAGQLCERLPDAIPTVTVTGQTSADALVDAVRAALRMANT